MNTNYFLPYIREQRAKKAFLVVLLIATLAFISISPAYANTVDGAWNTATVDAGKILQRLALVGGSVGLAWCGIEFAYGSEETSRKAKAKAIAIVVAAAAMFALPYFIRLGKSIGSQYKWDPSHLG